MATTYTVIEHDTSDADQDNHRPLADSLRDGDVLIANHDYAAGNIGLAWEQPVFPLVYENLRLKSRVNNQVTIDYINNPRNVPPADVCYRISELAKAEKNMMKAIEESANVYRIGQNAELAPGTHFPDYPPMGENNVAMSEQDYWTDFFAHDAIAYNHNGVVNVSTVDNTGAPAPALVPQTITGFQAYASDPSAVIRADALRYYKPGLREPYSKYAMPEIMFRVNNLGNVILGPTEPNTATGTHIDINANPPTVNTGNNPLPHLNGLDHANLIQVVADYVDDPTKIVMVDGTRRNWKTGFTQTIKVRSFQDLRVMYSFPNFLLGEMLQKEQHRVGPVLYGRPIIGLTDFWVKLYNQDFPFPYNKKKYVLPPGWIMLERADGIIVYQNISTNTIQPNPPPGSYMIALLNNSPIIASPRHVAIVAAVDAAMGVMNNGAAAVPVANFTNFQQSLQLVAYMENLKLIGQAANIRPIPAGGSKTKKLKRRRAVKSKSKSKFKSKSMFKSTKRAFYRMNKRNKTLRKY